MSFGFLWQNKADEEGNTRRNSRSSATFINAAAESKDLEMESSKRELIESVFAGDGEMATRMRALDWSMTALGPVNNGRKPCEPACALC